MVLPTFYDTSTAFRSLWEKGTISLHKRYHQVLIGWRCCSCFATYSMRISHWKECLCSGEKCYPSTLCFSFRQNPLPVYVISSTGKYASWYHERAIESSSDDTGRLRAKLFYFQECCLDNYRFGPVSPTQNSSSIGVRFSYEGIVDDRPRNAK